MRRMYNYGEIYRGEYLTKKSNSVKFLTELSLHMPNLATANKPAVTSPGDSTSGIFIHNRGLQPLDISLPQLSNASIIHVDGLIGK